MGPVNLRAEVEAEEIGTQIETIAREREELGTAIAKLRGSIGHLNREGRERLGAVFAEVDRHFQALFTRMFNGGRAHLAMVGSDDPLEAGLEIYAQPPGKKLATLSLLSGGEQALTALSLIFAVFRCNPAPVCVLDEVDAPLDDANVDRFCTLLEDMVRETGTRFLVVTHHHLTMARMDRLYGVTMQERGVSRLLSVDLRRAARWSTSPAWRPSRPLRLTASFISAFLSRSSRQPCAPPARHAPSRHRLRRLRGRQTAGDNVRHIFCGESAAAPTATTPRRCSTTPSSAVSCRALCRSVRHLPRGPVRGRSKQVLDVLPRACTPAQIMTSIRYAVAQPRTAKPGGWGSIGPSAPDGPAAAGSPDAFCRGDDGRPFTIRFALPAVASVRRYRRPPRSRS